MSLLPKTKGALIEALANEGHSGISLLAVKVGMDGRAVGANRLDRAMALVRAAEGDVEREEARLKQLEMAETLLVSASAWQLSKDGRLQALLRALELEGYAYVDGRLLPATPAPVALQEAVSNLEILLADAGYNVALQHYRQSVDNYVDGNHEAANGQVRSFLEDLFIRLCGTKRGKDVKDAGAALQHLYNTDWLDKGEYNHYRHFWDDIQDNGPHHGLSSAEESLFRLHYATAVAQYLLSKQL